MIHLLKGLVPPAEGIQLYLLGRDGCRLFAMQDGDVITEHEVAWDDGQWMNVAIGGRSLTVFVDTKPWRPDEEVRLPEAPQGEWFWLSFAGWREDKWYDGPLGWFSGAEVASYLPPQGPANLALPNPRHPERERRTSPLTATKPWTEIHSATSLAASRLHNAAIALACRFERPPLIVAETLDAEAAASLVCLARAFPEERLLVEVGEMTPPARKFLTHIGAKFEVSGKERRKNQVASIDDLNRLVEPFGAGLVEEVNRLSQVIPEGLFRSRSPLR